jgi:hypothetical protein
MLKIGQLLVEVFLLGKRLWTAARRAGVGKILKTGSCGDSEKADTRVLLLIHFFPLCHS